MILDLQEMEENNPSSSTDIMYSSSLCDNNNNNTRIQVKSKSKTSTFLVSCLVFLLLFIAGECNSLSLPSRLAHQLHQNPQVMLPPEYQPHESYKFEIQENSEANLVVGQVVVRDSFEYSFIQETKEFSLDPLTGIISTTAYPCDRESQEFFRLAILAIANPDAINSVNYSIAVDIHVLDVNDNPPRFTRLFNTEISEAAPKGSLVMQVTSSDRDADLAFTDASYSLVEPSNIFEMDSKSGKIFLVGSLDREKKDEYLLMVVANDSSWRAQTTVTVTVLDENDNPPVFEKNHYDIKKIFVPGNPDNESRVGRVRATDADHGLNGEVEYSFRDFSSLWSINPSTGEISMKEVADPSLSLNHDLSRSLQDQQGKRSFHLSVIARDKGTPSLSAEVSVTISILTADSLEASSFSGMQAQDVRIPLPLDLKNGSVMYTLRSEDGVALQAVSPMGSYPSLVRVSGNRLEFVAPTSPLRLGSRQVFTFKSREENFNITLIVVRPNLHVPLFSQKRYQLTVPENKNVSELLAPFQAYDADPDEGNRNVAYSYSVTEVIWNDRAIDYYQKSILKTNSSSSTSSQMSNQEISDYFSKKELFTSMSDPFRLDPETGTLVLKNPLDFELVIQYRLEITAKDGAVFGTKNSSSLVVIHVSDINDNRPIFTNTHDIELEVYENNLIGQIIGDIRAVDFDSLPNSQITFELEPLYDYSNFSISAKTGQIQALVSFDFEKKSEYQISIIAKNDNLKSSVVVKVNVRDINELNVRTHDSLSFGVVVILMFFVTLMIIISLTFVAWCRQKMQDDKDGDENNSHGPIYGSGSIGSMPRKMPTSNIIPIKEASGMSLMPTPSHLFNGHHPSKMTYPPPQVVQRQTSSQIPPHPPHPPHPHSHAHLHSLHSLTHHHHQHHPTARAIGNGGNQYPGAAGVPTPKSQPDILDSPSSGGQQRMHPPAPPSSATFSDDTAGRRQPSCDNYSEILAANEQYDLENASSIAPSDIDLAFMYKGYPPPLPPVHPHSLIKSSSGAPGGQQSNLDKPVEQRQLPPPVPMPRISPSNTPARIVNLSNLNPVAAQHPSAQRKMICSRRPETSSTDDEGNNTVDSFTSSSEYEEAYKIEHQNRKTMGFKRVW